jgi:hypothetical protein
LRIGQSEYSEESSFGHNLFQKLNRALRAGDYFDVLRPTLRLERSEAVIIWGDHRSFVYKDDCVFITVDPPEEVFKYTLFVLRRAGAQHVQPWSPWRRLPRVNPMRRKLRNVVIALEVENVAWAHAVIACAE